MLIFSIIIYVLFGAMCVWFIFSGVQKMKEIKASQVQESESRTSIFDQTKEQENSETTATTTEEE